MSTATDLSNNERTRIDNHYARCGGFGFADGCPCRSCGRCFPTAKGRRRHERRTHERSVPANTDLAGLRLPGNAGETPDPLDSPDLKGAELRSAVRRRLRYLAGHPEEP